MLVKLVANFIFQQQCLTAQFILMRSWYENVFLFTMQCSFLSELLAVHTLLWECSLFLRGSG